MKIYVINYKKLHDENGSRVEEPWLNHNEAFRCRKHAEAEIEQLKALELDQELYAYSIDECILK